MFDHFFLAGYMTIVLGLIDSQPCCQTIPLNWKIITISFLKKADARSNNLYSMDSATLLEAKSRQSCATARTTVSGRCIALAFQRVPTQKCIHKAV